MKKTTKVVTRTIVEEVEVNVISISDFIGFLSRKKLLSKFFTAYEHERPDIDFLPYCIGGADPRTVITSAFHWYESKEGHEFWQNVHESWLQWLKDSNVDLESWEEDDAEI